MSSEPFKAVPGVGPLAVIRGLRNSEFLAYVEHLWKTHGDIFQMKFGTRRVIFTMHPDAVRHINLTHRDNYDKLSTHDVLRRYLFGNGLVASTGELWRRQRKLMSPFFRPKAVQTYADIMLLEGGRLLGHWEKLARNQSLLDIDTEMMQVTAAIILKAMFSTEADAAILDMKDAVASMLSFAQARLAGLPPPVWIPTATNRRYLAARHKVYSYIDGLIGERRRLSATQWPDDLLSALMRARDEETGASMPDDLLRDECITMFVGGHETTARTMTTVWYALATNPDTEKKLHDELDRVLGNRSPTIDDLGRLPYALQIIKEAMRLYPPAPFYIREAVKSDHIDGYAIPAGAGVMMSPYFTHRHPDFWINPLKFDPDRWLPEREATLHPCAYHPFAIGQRMCIGYSFSLLEAHLLLALLARRFAPRLVPGYTPQWTMQSTLGARNGFPMRIQPRSPAVGLPQ